jgi:hypothetical protein
LAEQFFAPYLELPLPDRAPHQLGDYRALILITECLIKCRLNFVRNTEINRGHSPSPLLKTSTMKLYASRIYRQCQFQRNFAQFSLVGVILAVPVAVTRNRPVRVAEPAVDGAVRQRLYPAICGH